VNNLCLFSDYNYIYEWPGNISLRWRKRSPP